MPKQVEDIHPFVWWIKVDHCHGAPRRFWLDRDGTLYGCWDDGFETPLRDADMRFYGYEKCFCSPFGGQPAPDCIAHNLVGKDE